jgi:hypothetical protein
MTPGAKRIRLTNSCGRGFYIGPDPYVETFLYVWPENIVAMQVARGGDGKPYTLLFVENRTEPFDVVESPDEIEAKARDA